MRRHYAFAHRCRLPCAVTHMSGAGQQRALRVLVVDDHQLFRTGLRELLAYEGFEAADAGGGEAALARVRNFAPDVVLMDVNMPGMSGIEATRLLRAAAPTTAVLMLTGAGEDELVLRALCAGASGYLLKDVELGEMASAIRTVAAGQCALSPRAARALVDRIRLNRDEETADGETALRLSERERQVLALVVHGLDNAEIGRRLFVSPSTVKNHVSRLLEKLAVDNRVQAAIYAVRHRLVDEALSS
jgi:DNA-binding NarL/FixJ family response regulator